MTGALHHYPRRFRWSSARDWNKRRLRAALTIDGRNVGGVVQYSDGRGWSAWCYGAGSMPERHARRCDAKRAVECAAVEEERRREAMGVTIV